MALGRFGTISGRTGKGVSERSPTLRRHCDCGGRVTLTAEVRRADAKYEFTVTEVYQRQGTDWRLLALTFSGVRDDHTIRT